ncbi:MAG: hypothetical protein QOH23_2023, partial [Gaiellaceae bacterium]|nr:hypothetical protein [Gaiellaceae bacterium]
MLCRGGSTVRTPTLAGVTFENRRTATPTGVRVAVREGVTVKAQSTRTAELPVPAGRLARLGHFTARYRWPVIAAWIVLTLFGGYAAGQLSSRWYQSLAVPGQPAYEGSQRTL